ncbi:MAG: hypothetical protein K2L08_01630 [Erysipelotrichaceae bacterium]|nr:hypothetical protein [Erysipelotrichaceae bacterium]
MRFSYFFLIVASIYLFIVALPLLFPLILILLIIVCFKAYKLRRQMYTYEEYSYHQSHDDRANNSIHGDVIDVEFEEREE